MLLLFYCCFTVYYSVRVAELSSVSESVVHSVYCVFRKGLSICVCFSFPFGFECRMWDLNVLVPDHCRSIYFGQQ